VQEDILEKELVEIQKVLLAMQVYVTTTTHTRTHVNYEDMIFA